MKRASTNRAALSSILVLAALSLGSEVFADEPSQVLTIVAFGDSTTAIRRTVKQVYADRLPELLKVSGINAKVINAGVGGSHTGRLIDNARHKRRHALDRLDDAVRNHKPDIVVVQFGWNDSWVDSDKPNGLSRIPVDKYAANLAHIVDTLSEDGARVILMTPNRPRSTVDDWRVKRTQQYVHAVRNLAEEKRISLVDVWSEYDRFDKAKTQSADDLLLDSVHPNDKGHELVASMLTKLIGRMQAEAAFGDRWSELPPLPDKFGFGGPIVGVHAGGLIVAGGANFPNGPPWSVDGKPAGDKVWHDRIFVLLDGAREWIEAGNLPSPLAYAPAISTEDGVYVLGGETHDTTNHPVASVLLLKWDADSRRVVVKENALSPLPKPCHYHNAAVIDDVIYVTASHVKNPTSQRLDEKSFWALDLSKSSAERKWMRREPWPGPAREKMAIATQNHKPHKDKLATKCLYIFSGATWFKDETGNADLSKFQHFNDAYRYNPSTGKWNRIADLPAVPELRTINIKGYAFSKKQKAWRKIHDGESQHRIDVRQLFDGISRPAGAATAIAESHNRVLLFSGATGRFITLDIAQRPLFPREVLSYRTDTNQWSIAGQMPVGVVTTSAVRWRDQIVVPNGEVRPGVRTNKVQAFDATTRIGGVPVDELLRRLGAKLESGASEDQVNAYVSHFNRIDLDRDGKHTREEFVEKGRYLTAIARAGIFRAADSNSDRIVTKNEYILNRIITDEAKAIVQAMDDDKDGVVTCSEFIGAASRPLSGRCLATKVFSALDTNADDRLEIPEYLRVWGRWARVRSEPTAE